MQSMTSEPNKNTAKINLTTPLSTPQTHKINMVLNAGSAVDESDTEEVVVEGVAAPAATLPLSVPGSSYTQTLNPALSSVKGGGDLSGASSDSADSDARKLKKKSIPYYESVGRSYRALAEERGWKNHDGSIFPISVTNLCHYVRVKKDTNNSKSVDWYITALKKYQDLVLNIKDWDEVRKHPEVKQLMSQIKVEGNSKIGGDFFSGKDEGKGNKENSIVEIIKNNLEFPHSNEVNPQFGSHSNLPLQTFSSTNQFPGPAETALALLSPEFNPFMVDDDSIGRKDLILSKKLVDDTLEGFGSPNYVPSTSKLSSRLDSAFDQMLISASDDDEDYVPPTKKSSSTRGYIPDRKRRRKRHLDSESHSDDDEPESFKSRYETSLSVLKTKYTNTCKQHPNGCYVVKNGKHFVLNDKLLRRWASLCASGDDVDEDSLPCSDELERDFSELKAVLI